jgi:hypothetical protein
MERWMADKQKENTCELYEIKIQGHLDTGWSEWFYGLTITHEPDGATTLCGPLPDQAVLYSILERIRDMNLPLISVNKIVSDGQIMNEEVKGERDDEHSINATKNRMERTQKGETDYEN